METVPCKNCGRGIQKDPLVGYTAYVHLDGWIACYNTATTGGSAEPEVKR